MKSEKRHSSHPRLHISVRHRKPSTVTLSSASLEVLDALALCAGVSRSSYVEALIMRAQQEGRGEE
ncbi:MAG: hypothetical protein KF795_30175 [Labilithrix sp.]|nr:hypothetical protein [Labilithrix sp.]